MGFDLLLERAGDIIFSGPVLLVRIASMDRGFGKLHSGR